MRRKPSNGTYPSNNQHRRPQRYQQGSNGGEQRSQGSYQHSGHGRPKRNYGASREKYLNQAREALAAGDRVLAENYFQHADHCYRMMVEEGSYRPNYTPPPSQDQDSDGSANGEASGNSDGSAPVAAPEEFNQENTNQLPAFLTAHVEPSGHENPAPPVQNWEERDA